MATEGDEGRWGGRVKNKTGAYVVPGESGGLSTDAHRCTQMGRGGGGVGGERRRGRCWVCGGVAGSGVFGFVFFQQAENLGLERNRGDAGGVVSGQVRQGIVQAFQHGAAAQGILAVLVLTNTGGIRRIAPLDLFHSRPSLGMGASGRRRLRTATSFSLRSTT